MKKILTLLIVIVALFSPSLAVAQDNCGSSCIIFNGINHRRAAYKRVPLKYDLRLEKAAMIKACDMKNNHYFSHEDLQGNMSWHLFVENDYKYTQAGENLSRWTADANVTQAFMNSFTHKANIIYGSYREIGIGRCGTYVAVEFGVLI